MFVGFVSVPELGDFRVLRTWGSISRLQRKGRCGGSDSHNVPPTAHTLLTPVSAQGPAPLPQGHQAVGVGHMHLGKGLTGS